MAAEAHGLEETLYWYDRRLCYNINANNTCDFHYEFYITVVDKY